MEGYYFYCFVAQLFIEDGRMEEMYEFLKQYILYLRSIEEYRQVGWHLSFFSRNISLEQSIVLRERILKEESISTLKNNGILAGFIALICCLKDRTL